MSSIVMQPVHRTVAIVAAFGGLCFGMVRGQERATAEPVSVESATMAPQLVATGEALAAANLERDALRAENERLRLQIESLGLAAMKPDTRAVQERLVKALGELSALRRRNERLAETMAELQETAAAVVADPSNVDARRAYETAAKAATAAQQSDAPGATAAVPLDSAKVVSYKPDLGLAVVNVGRESGLRSGTPVDVLRGERAVASGVVLDLRDRIAGVLVTRAADASIKVGDAVRPHTESSSPSSEQ